MKYIYLLIIACTFFIYSCSDEIGSSESLNSEVDIRQQKGVDSNGRWLVFNDLKTYKTIYEELEREMNAYVDKRKDTDAFQDDFPMLGDFENYFYHKSLRMKLELELHGRLDRGEDPNDILNSLDDKGVVDEILLSFLNEDGVVQVGRDIYVFLRDGIEIKIANKNVSAVDACLTQGYKVVYDLDYAKDIEVSVGKTTAEAECKSEFTVFNQNYDEDAGTWNVSFVWDQMDFLDKFKDLEFHWQFGDGTFEKTTNASINHAYDAKGTYSVCLAISGERATADADGNTVWVKCNDEYCENVTLEGVPFSGCDLLEAVSLLPNHTVGDKLMSAGAVAQNPNETCVSVGGLISFIVQLEDYEQSEFVWQIEGQSYTGAQICFPTPCAGDYEGILTISDCASISFTISIADETGVCIDNDTDTGWDETLFSGDERKIETRMRTDSEENNWNGLKQNKIVVRMRHFKKNNNGKFKKRKTDILKVESSGNVYADGSCDCITPHSVAKDETKYNAKFIRMVKKWNTMEAISINSSDVWDGLFYVDGNHIVTKPAYE